MDLPEFFADWTCSVGVGDFNEYQACVMALAVAMDRLAKGEPLGTATDELECVCPVVRRLAISANDDGGWASDEARTTWAKGVASRLLNTNLGVAVSIKRAEHCARVAAREYAARAMDAAGLMAWAEALRGLAPDADMRTVQRVSAAAAADAWRAWRAWRAAADAADAADAANAAANAAADAYAADATADAAVASYATYAAYAERLDSKRQLLEELLAITQ